MAKTKSIENRPLIVVTLTTTKWNLERRKDTKEFVTVSTDGSDNKEITQHKIIKVKPETASTGRFRLLTGRWYGSVILPDDLKSVYECHRDNLNQYVDSMAEAFEVLEKAIKNRIVSSETNVLLEREKETYYNPKTGKVTASYEEAAKWFKGQNPLFISSSQYQKIGIWLEPGEDYVEVNFYYNHRIQRSECGKWTKAKTGGFRLYNDGTISHFYKGKVYDNDRIFEEKRIKYRTLDVRFREQYRLTTLALDLRSPKLIGSDGSNTKLCQESLEILKKAGFPQEYWCWGNTRRPFVDTYDLVNFATHIQHKNQTNRGASIDSFLADKPFGLGSENVLKFNKGVIIRVPGYREVWVDGDGRHYTYEPGPWETNTSKIKMLKAEVYERYRVWISDNGKTRSCQELIHDGDCWSQTRWDNICWPEGDDYKPTTRRSDSTATEKEQMVRNKALAQFKKISSATYSKIYKLLPVLIRFESFVKEHPDLERGSGIRNLLDALYRAPKLTETLIKLGYGDWFYHQHNERYDYYSGNSKSSFTIEHALSRFGINYISEYKEFSGNSMYQNLGVSKEQFAWLAQYKEAGNFMNYFKATNYLIPNTSNEHYENFAAVPVKYLKIIATAVESMRTRLHSRDYWEPANKIQNLLNQFGYTPLDIEKALNRGLDLQVLCDYLRLRNSCVGAQNFNIRDWDKMPSDPNDLRFCHDRMCAFYNLIQAERNRYWREQEEKRMIERQNQYEERYKKLKALSYMEEEDIRTIVVPKKLIELVVEGQILHHCVGSFAASVAEGKDTIVFLRDKEKPDVPYATVSLLKVGDVWRIDQAHTAHNGPITAEDVEFLKRWAVKNNVDPSTVHTNYGMHCHH